MINKDELQNAIKEYFISKIENKMQMVEITETNADIQKIIEELDANPWNPISESLPTDNKYILLSFENFSVPCIGRYEEDKDGNGCFYVGDEDESLVSQGMFVNAWMDLPKSYREEI